MSEWPPRWEDTFIFRESGVPPYYRKIESELRKRGAYFLALTNREQSDLKEALFIIDMAASSAARELLKSPWSTAQLFKLESPKGANPFGAKKEKDKFNQWIRYREHQSCLRFCRRARRALLIGNWGQAIHAAIYAGYHLNGARAVSAQNSLPGLRGGSLSNQLRAQRNRETILREARELGARPKRYNVRSIAAEIAAKHKLEKGFPRYDSIRRTLGQDRSWESRA
jgi:hypothetical protein